MKINGIIILMVIMMSSCSVSVKKLTVTPADSERGDAVFSLIGPDNNYGKIEDIHLYSWTHGGKLNVNRVLVDFNLDKIPSTARIDSAFLSLYLNPNSTYYDKVGGSRGQESIVIQRVTSAWNEDDVTWNNQPKTTSVNQLIITNNKKTKEGYIDIDITNLIQDIVKEDDGRYGILIKYKNEKPYNAVFFASSNNPNKHLHPKLSVHYRKK